MRSQEEVLYMFMKLREVLSRCFAPASCNMVGIIGFSSWGGPPYNLLRGLCLACSSRAIFAPEGAGDMTFEAELFRASLYRKTPTFPAHSAGDACCRESACNYKACGIAAQRHVEPHGCSGLAWHGPVWDRGVRRGFGRLRRAGTHTVDRHTWLQCNPCTMWQTLAALDGSRWPAVTLLSFLHARPRCHTATKGPAQLSWKAFTCYEKLSPRSCSPRRGSREPRGAAAG